jgi:hypothetical protein
VLAVTSFDEATTVLKDTDTFSSCIAVGGPFPPLPFTPEGEEPDDHHRAADHRQYACTHEDFGDQPDHLVAVPQRRPDCVHRARQAASQRNA